MVKIGPLMRIQTAVAAQSANGQPIKAGRFCVTFRASMASENLRQHAKSEEERVCLRGARLDLQCQADRQNNACRKADTG